MVKTDQSDHVHVISDWPGSLFQLPTSLTRAICNYAGKDIGPDPEGGGGGVIVKPLPLLLRA